MIEKYLDIIDLPRPVSKKHKPMSNYNRGAQFAPFAALNGYGDQIIETGRTTKEKIELDEYEKGRINDALLYIKDNRNVKINIVHFVKDKLKSGGEYLSQDVTVKRLDEDNHELILSDGNTIEIDDIMSLSIRQE